MLFSCCGLLLVSRPLLVVLIDRVAALFSFVGIVCVRTACCYNRLFLFVVCIVLLSVVCCSLRCSVVVICLMMLWLVLSVVCFSLFVVAWHSYVWVLFVCHCVWLCVFLCCYFLLFLVAWRCCCSSFNASSYWLLFGVCLWCVFDGS